MAKENEPMNAQTQTPEPSAAPSATPNRDKMLSGLRGKYGEELSEEELFGKAMEGWDAEHTYAKKSRKEADDINGYLQADENVNNFFVDLMEWGPKGKAWKAFINLRPIWRQYINGELQDEEFESALRDMEANYAEIERKKEMAAKAFDRVCEKRGWDPDETRKKLSDLLFAEVNTDAEAEQQVENMFRVLDFDSAVAAAETRGRNENIAEQRRNVPTSAPKGGAGVKTATAPKKGLDVFDLAGAAS